MANAGKIVKAWIKAIAKGTAESTAQHLAPSLEWLENGLPFEKAVAANPREKWRGIDHPDFKFSAKEVCGDDRAVVMEFAAGHGGAERKFCGVFKVAKGRIASAHWYGDPAAGAELLQKSKRRGT